MPMLALDYLDIQLKSNHDVSNQYLSNVLHIIEPIMMLEYYSRKEYFHSISYKIYIQYLDWLVVYFLIYLVYHVEFPRVQ